MRQTRWLPCAASVRLTPVHRTNSFTDAWKTCVVRICIPVHLRRLRFAVSIVGNQRISRAWSSKTSGQRWLSRRSVSAGSFRSRPSEAPIRRERLSAPRRRPIGCVSRVLHGRDVGLARATDAAIWGYAREHNLTIVSKDSDFHQVTFLRGPPPKVIWIRRGNCTTADIEALLRSSRTEAVAFGADAEAAFLALS